METPDPPGSLIGYVLADLVERVTALEEGRRPHRRPTVLDPEDVRPSTKSEIRAEMVRLYQEGRSLAYIARITDYNVKTVRTQLRKAGVKEPAHKKETT